MSAAEQEMKPGDVRAHTTDELSSMADVGLELQLAGGVKLWAGEISRDRWEKAGSDAHELGSDGGWWIILYEKDETHVIAKAVDRDAAEAMIDAISAAIRSARMRH